MLAELTREANRSNVTMYTIDPRGLVGPLSDLDQEVEPQQWQEFVRKSQDSLRVLAEDTGGIAVVNQNDFDKALKRIDAETSDYYVLGYYSSNPDPTQRRRRLEVRVDASRTERPVAQGIRAADRAVPPPPAASRKQAVCVAGLQVLPGLGPARAAAVVAVPLFASGPCREREFAARRGAIRPFNRHLQIRFVEIRPDEADAQPGAGDRRAAEPRERIHHHFDARQPVQPQALLRQA